MRRFAWPAVMAVLVLAACGAPSGGDMVRTATEQLAELEAGEIDLAVEVATVDGDATTGFRLQGGFAFPEDGGLPEADVVWTRTDGQRESSARVVSDGQRAVVEVDGEEHPLTREQEDLLRAAAPRGDSVPLRLERWLADAERTGERMVRGRLDVAAVVADLTALQRGMAPDGGQAGALGDAELARLERATEVARYELRVDEDGLPRAFDAEIVLGADDLPEGLTPVRFTMRFRLDQPRLRA